MIISQKNKRMRACGLISRIQAEKDGILGSRFFCGFAGKEFV